VSWEALGAIGEIVGAIGVIVTLLYLSTQIRQNTKASKAATVQNMTDKWVQINLFLADNARAPVLLADPELGDADRARALAMWRALFHQWSNNHYQYKQGVLDEALFKPTAEEIKRIAHGGPGGRSIRGAWNLTRHIYNDDFGALMDELLGSDEGGE